MSALGGDGIISGALVEGNVIYDNGVGGGSGINCDGVQNSTIRNNLIYNKHASGISLYRIDGGGGSSGNLVVNNTVIVAADGRWALNIQSGSTGNTVRNNILLQLPLVPRQHRHQRRQPGRLQQRLQRRDEPLHDQRRQQRSRRWPSGRPSGPDLHSIVATPSQLFVNPAASIFTCRPRARRSMPARRSSRRRSISKATPGPAAAASISAPTSCGDGTPPPPPPTITADRMSLISGSSVNENSAAARVVGTLSAIDPNAGDSHSFTLLNNAGGRFAIAGNQLVVAGAAQLRSGHEPHASSSARPTPAALSFDKSLTISVQNVNELVGFDVQQRRRAAVVHPLSSI